MSPRHDEPTERDADKAARLRARESSVPATAASGIDRCALDWNDPIFGVVYGSKDGWGDMDPDRYG